MSLWLRDRVRLWVSPARVVAASDRSVLHRTASPRTLFDETVAPSDPRGDRVAQVLQALERHAAAIGRRARIDVALSDHFVRYLALPWRDGLGHDDWEIYARHEFERVYGRAGTRRRVRIAAARSGKPRVAAAVDGALFDGLHALASSARGRIGAVESNLCRIVNRCERHFARDGHLFVAEPGRLTRLSISDRTWGDVQSVRCGSEVGEAVARMLRELEFASGSIAGNAATVWYWGHARAEDVRSALDGNRFDALPLSPPPHCATMGMI